MSVGSLILQFFAKHLLQHSSFERRQWTGLWFRYIRMRCPAVDPAATVLALDDEAMFLQILRLLSTCGKRKAKSLFTRVAVITGSYHPATGVAGWSYILHSC